MNGAYGAVALALLTALAKKGLISGSASKVNGSNPHLNRVRVNFNLNRSTFSKNVSDKDKYFQYSIYGNTSNIGNIQIQSQSKQNKPNDKGNVLGWSEIVCLKDVTVYCDTGAMKRFHEALLVCQKEALRKGLSPHGKNNDQYFKYINQCIKDFKFENSKGQLESVIKSPFCFFEGNALSFDEFQRELSKDGFSFDAPSGLAKFNPRDPHGQPPIFLFSEIKTGEEAKERIDISSFPAIIGAKYVCMLNTIETSFAPVYVWGPTVCSQDMIWDKSTGKLKNWLGRQATTRNTGYTNKVNTYNLYFNVLNKGKTLQDGYTYISKTSELPKNYKIKTIVEQKDDEGNLKNYKGPARAFIMNQDYRRKKK